MKKRRIFVMIFLVFLLVFGIIIRQVRGNYIRWRYNPKNVELYEEDYMRIVYLAFQQWEENGHEETFLSVEYDLSRASEQIIDVSLSRQGRKIELSDEQNRSLKSICNDSFSFDNRALSWIRINENQVEFLSESFQYALIYTKNGEEPETYPENGSKCLLKKVDANWYQISCYEDVVFFP